MEERKTFTVAYENAKHGGLYYSFLVFFVVAASLVFSLVVMAAGGQDGAEEITSAVWYKYISYSLSGLIAIILSSVFCRFTEKNLKQECGLISCDKKYYLYALLLFVGMTFGLSGLNGYFTQFLVDNFGYKYNAIQLPEGNLGYYALTVVTVCVLPAIAEETAFRGICVNSLRGAGKWGVALLNGFIFSLFHMSPAQTPYQFAVGFSFALLALSSRSVLPTVSVHFLNNFLIV
ncbi:MAG: CPBP family intramembrane metalloprotease, partial [Clostridia bacterium]|nr:CPBP family intramembrane metalloprotease [Clostridia bacterium]